jgi:hypothetical protein
VRVFGTVRTVCGFVGPRRVARNHRTRGCCLCDPGTAVRVDGCSKEAAKSLFITVVVPNPCAEPSSYEQRSQDLPRRGGSIYLQY